MNKYLLAAATLAVAAYVGMLLAIAITPDEPCFTDTCVGCTDDCLDSQP